MNNPILSLEDLKINLKEYAHNKLMSQFYNSYIIQQVLDALLQPFITIDKRINDILEKFDIDTCTDEKVLDIFAEITGTKRKYIDYSLIKYLTPNSKEAAQWFDAGEFWNEGRALEGLKPETLTSYQESIRTSIAKNNLENASIINIQTAIYRIFRGELLEIRFVRLGDYLCDIYIPIETPEWIIPELTATVNTEEYFGGWVMPYPVGFRVNKVFFEIAGPLTSDVIGFGFDDGKWALYSNQAKLSDI